MKWFYMLVQCDNEVIMDYFGFTKRANGYEYESKNICEVHDRVKIMDSLGYKWSVSEQDDFDPEHEEVGYYNEIQNWLERYGEE